MKLIEREVKAWLETKKPNAIVGKTLRNCMCPLATYLKEQTGKVWNVDNWNYSIHRDREGNSCRELPGWAEEFVDRVDDLGKAGYTVRAKQALALLN